MNPASRIVTLLEIILSVDEPFPVRLNIKSHLSD